MEDWKKVKLGEVCESISETYNAKHSEVVLINTSDVLNGKVLNHKSEKNINLKGQFKKTFTKNDILYSEIRPQNLRFAYIDFINCENYIISTKLMVIRALPSKINSFYLYQILKSPDIISTLQRIAETRSGTFPQITYNEMAKLEILLPPLAEQERIASILSALDDKIEVNNKINKNLEEQAQALFKDVYDAIEDSYNAISEFLDIRDGTHDSPKLLDTGYSFVTSRNLLPFGVDIKNINKISYEDFIKINERSKVDTGDILLSMIGTTGLISLVIEEEIDFAIKNVGLFKTSKKPYLKYYIYEFLKSDVVQHLIDSKLAGTTQKYISLGELRKLPIKLPNENTIKEYYEKVSPLYNLIASNLQENEKLASIRDNLLPKLLSGEIRV